MTRGRLLRTRCLPAMLAGLLAAAAVAGCGVARPPQPPPSLGAAMNRSVPDAIRNLPLTTASGATTSLAAYRGKIVVVGDTLTLCQETCPMTSANFNRMAHAVGSAGLAHDVVFLEVTVDPQRDTAARLAAYRKNFSPAANWVLATAKPADIKRFWKFFGVFYKRTPEDSPPGIDWWTHKPLTYDVKHQDAVIFLGPDGHERFLMLGMPDTRGTKPPPKLLHFLNDEGRENLTHPARTAWSVSDGLRVVSWLAGTKIEA